MFLFSVKWYVLISSPGTQLTKRKENQQLSPIILKLFFVTGWLLSSLLSWLTEIKPESLTTNILKTQNNRKSNKMKSDCKDLPVCKVKRLSSILSCLTLLAGGWNKFLEWFMWDLWCPFQVSSGDRQSLYGERRHFMFSQHCTGQVCALSHSKQKQALEGLRENVKSACLGKLAIGFAIGILASHMFRRWKALCYPPSCPTLLQLPKSLLKRGALIKSP